MKNCFFLLFLLLCPAWAQAFETPAKSAILLDLTHRQILLDKNADQRIPTASMSKLLTMYVVFEAIKNGELKLSDALPVSEKAWRMQGSKTFVELNARVKVEDLVRGVIVQSGNDACIVLAEGIAGSEENFVARMNAAAQKLGLKNSHFMNVTGWPDPEHYSTVRDLAALAAALMRDFPEYYHYYSEKDFTYHGIKQGNRNPLLYANIGADGVKTGHTDEAGYGLIGSALQQNRRLLMVVSGLESMEARASAAVDLMKWGFTNFRERPLFAQKSFHFSVPVWDGTAAAVNAELTEDVSALLPADQAGTIKARVRCAAPVAAPVRKGQEVATLLIDAGDAPLVTVPLIASQDVAAVGVVGRIINNLHRLWASQ